MRPGPPGAAGGRLRKRPRRQGAWVQSQRPVGWAVGGSLWNREVAPVISGIPPISGGSATLKSLQRRRRGRKSKTTKSLSNHQNRRSDVWERGDLCNSPNKINPAKNS
jgi:hypothetical protein